MLAVRHCSSKARFLFGAALSALALSGCTGKDAKPSLLGPPASLINDAGNPVVVQPIASFDASPGVITIKPALINDQAADTLIVTASASSAGGGSTSFARRSYGQTAKQARPNYAAR